MIAALNNHSMLNNLRVIGGIKEDHFYHSASAYVLEKRIIKKLNAQLTLEVFIELKPLLKRRPSTYRLERFLVYLTECVERLNIQHLMVVEAEMNSDFNKAVLMITGKWQKK